MAGLGAIRLLIVDDNAQMRMLIRSMLRAAGLVQCMEAKDVDEGMDIMRSFSPDIVLLDLAMKPKDGSEFVRRARARTSPNPFVAIIMMTCHSQRTQVATARDAGVNSFLAKPITGRSLIEHLLAAVNDGRPFVRVQSFFGPDRRRLAAAHYLGPWRRETDKEKSSGGDGFDLDSMFSPQPAMGMR